MRKRKISNELKNKGAKAKAIGCMGIGIVVLLLCSCVSFNIGDWPSKFVYPHNEPPANWCGSIGAFCAYHLLYYFGPGVFIILVASICFLIAWLLHRPIGQPVLRAIGLGLLAVAASSNFYLFWPHRLFGFPIGSGGLLGVGAATFLRSHFATLGTLILIAATWIVGFILLADDLFIWVLLWLSFAGRKILGVAVPAWSAARQQSEALSEIWQKLSARQKSLDAHTPCPVTVEPMDEERETRDESRAEPAKAPASDPSKTTFGQPVYEDYVLPPLELLAEAEYSFAAVQEKVVKAKAGALEKLLSEFHINARVVAAETGPVVTMFELELAAGIKVSQISTLANDIARALELVPFGLWRPCGANIRLALRCRIMKKKKSA